MGELAGSTGWLPNDHDSIATPQNFLEILGDGRQQLKLRHLGIHTESRSYGLNTGRAVVLVAHLQRRPQDGEIVRLGHDHQYAPDLQQARQARSLASEKVAASPAQRTDGDFSSDAAQRQDDLLESAPLFVIERVAVGGGLQRGDHPLKLDLG